MSLLRPSYSKDVNPPHQLGVSKPRQPLQAWSEVAEDDDDTTKRAHSGSVNGATARLGTLRTGSTLQNKFDGYLSDGSQESSACDRTDASNMATATATQPSRRKYLHRHVSTELDSMAPSEPTILDRGSPRPSWSTISRRLSLGPGTNRFARAPAKVPSASRETGASLSINRPNFDEAPKTRGHTSWIGTIKMKLSARRRHRDRLDDQATAPIVRDCSFADRPTVRSDETIEGSLRLASVVSPTQPEPVSIYPRLRSQPSLNRPVSARQHHYGSARRDRSPGAHSHAADVMFVPEDGDAGEEYLQGASSSHPNRAQRRSQFLLPYQRSLVSEDKSPYTKLDGFDSAY
ncbi:hypothetical protein GGH95_000350 [Coemansia sp. RSA 1836]|nr:hypothetical protein GGH95_000350 [Coemansia sp. RSA 1836]